MLVIQAYAAQKKNTLYFLGLFSPQIDDLNEAFFFFFFYGIVSCLLTIILHTLVVDLRGIPEFLKS